MLIVIDKEDTHLHCSVCQADETKLIAAKVKKVTKRTTTYLELRQHKELRRGWWC